VTAIVHGIKLHHLSWLFLADSCCCLIVEHMDMLLYQCFMCALKTTARKAELPLLTSTFFRNHMVPHR